MAEGTLDTVPADASGHARRPAARLALLVLVLGMLAVVGIGQWYHEHLVKDEKVRLQTLAEEFGQRLATGTARRAALLQGVRTFVLQELEKGPLQPGLFEDYSRLLQTRADGIRYFALAPQLVVKYVCPLAENRVELGHNLLADPRPEVSTAVTRARHSDAVILSGPIPLPQGGLALIGQVAIRHQDRLWGLALMGIDFPSLLAEAGLEALPPGLRLALRSADGALLFGEPAALTGNPVTSEVELTAAPWTLALAPVDGWDASLRGRRLLLLGGGLLAVFGLALVTYRMLCREEALARQIRQRTTALDDELEYRRRSEQDLQRQQRTLQAFLDALPEAALLIKPDGQVLACNRIVRQRLKLFPEDPGHCNLFEALEPEVARVRKQMVDQVVKTGLPVRFIDERSGRSIANYLHPVSRESGEVRQLAHIGIDITERVELERRLRQMQKMESLGTLSGGVAHEFNNILTAIVGQTSLLEMKRPDDLALQAQTRQILAAAERGEKLTRALLTFSRRQATHQAVVDLNQLVPPVAAMLEPLLGEKIRLLVTPAEAPLSVRVDSGNIEQILLNLALNARDAMPAGGEIHLTASRVLLDQTFVEAHGGRLSPGYYACLSFEDTGLGMDKEIISRIFEPFFTTKEVGKGTGLGLSLALGMVQQNQGFLTCTSTPGVGTTFDLYFPLIAPGRED